MSETAPRDRWEARYGTAQVWSGHVNEALRIWSESHVPGAGGTALDLACGEGGDAIWLAEAGWKVTGVDFASSAIARAEQAAIARGLVISWVTADLRAWVPDAAYDFVALSFFHESAEVRNEVWRVAASAVKEGGTLLVTAHAPDAHPAAPGPAPDRRFEIDQLVEFLGRGWDLHYRESSRSAGARHGDHVVTDMIAQFTLRTRGAHLAAR